MPQTPLPAINLDTGLTQILQTINELRREGVPSDARTLAESFMTYLFDAPFHLAVYGSLAPGESNHHIVADIEGEWVDGFVRGILYGQGWGYWIGYPAMRWHPEGEPIPVKLFVSKELPDHWERLDTFEGSEYLRVLVPVYKDGFIAVANLYEARRG